MASSDSGRVNGDQQVASSDQQQQQQQAADGNDTGSAAGLPKGGPRLRPRHQAPQHEVSSHNDTPPEPPTGQKQPVTLLEQLLQL
jgi:hypothetical protein